MITIEQLKDIKERTEALNRYLDIEGKKIQVEEEQLRTQAPGFWDDQKAAEAQMKKVKGLQQWISGYNEVRILADELQLAFDFYKDELVTEEEVDEAYAKASAAVEALELKNMLREEADQMDCVLKINSGAGGTESQDWASMLMRMYLRYAETHGYKATIANLQEGDEAGIKACTIEIAGDYAYGYLKGENGVHRLVRVSPYNAQGKRMTSFASVFVTPLVDDTIEVNIECSQYLMGYVPFQRRGRTEREQGGIGRASALSVQRPLHRRGRGNPDREYRNARPAQEPRECNAPAALHPVRQGAPAPHGGTGEGGSRQE